MLQPIIAPQSSHVPMAPRLSRPTGLVPGTLVRTPEGELPVEYLLAGDKVYTVNNGIVEIRGTSVVEVTEIDMISIAPTAFGGEHGRPSRDLEVPFSQQILVKDWRAQLHGEDSILTPASSLVDNVKVRRESRENVRLIRLHFDQPQVIWADGIEIASARTRAPITRSIGLLH